MVESARAQLDRFVRMLTARSLDANHPTFKAALQWALEFPKELSPIDQVTLRDALKRCANITDETLDQMLVVPNGSSRGNKERWSLSEIQKAQEEEREFDLLVPPEGFFRDYIEYTQMSEAPIAYHFFVAVAGLAAIMNRRCWFPMGVVSPIYPPLGIILLGDSGIKKTSACETMTDLLRDTGLVPVYSEKLTPEALIEALSHGQATGLIYAPEMTTLLSRAQYQDHIVPLLTRFMDCPSEWKSETIGRGQTILKDVALTVLLASTVKWFVENTPESTFQGGFIARHLLVYQTVAPRSVPFPGAYDPVLRHHIMQAMVDTHEMQGPMGYDDQARDLYIEFYHENRMRKPEYEILDAYQQRKPGHVTRLAMMLHATRHRDHCVCLDCLTRALALLKFTERYFSSLVRKMFRKTIGADADEVLRIIRKNDAGISRTNLMHKVCAKMDAAGLDRVIKTLGEAGLVVEELNKLSRAKIYKAKPEAVEEEEEERQ